MRPNALLGIALLLFLAPRAWAKDVSISWKPMKKAASYELRVERAGRTVSAGKVKSARWSGDLPFGVFAYQIRAIDKIGRPGKWTPLKALAVMPESPDPVAPGDGDKIVYFDPAKSPKLKWEPVEGISRYEVELLRNGSVVLARETPATELELPLQPSGSYAWHVRPVLDPGTHRIYGSEGAFKGRKWKGKPGESFDFKLEYRALQSPALVFPVGPTLRSKSDEVEFRWKEVEGAEAYEVRFAPVPRGRRPASNEFRRFVTREPYVLARQVPDGTWVWEVRALASYDANRKVAAVAGTESRTDFQLETSVIHPEGKGYVALSGMLAPFNYNIDTTTPLQSPATGVGAVMRLSGEYWPKGWLGASLAINQGHMDLGDGNRTRTDLELYLKTQLSWSAKWFFQPKIGLLDHQYLRYLPDLSTATTQFQGRIQSRGLGVGFDLRRALSERWSLGFKFEYFVPMSLGVDGTSATLSGSENSRNLSVGLQAIWWVGPRWGLGMGAFIENRSVSYQLSTGLNESVN
ncbi:MAG TPA: autotransporter outer membrane beta-barrel domain-containing protein, partial [Bdellovibrionota bacterium]|nr:autotransporter outer membrane beta-barrel domain-containing protein [Bdellovibrionota bacterium]